ncbi:MAG: cysteine-rich CWC family protein [Alphaproteobacteria bacterium]|nr:cysteine-rich CWC family protein [Alphaproteobacteria bacterium]
MVTAGRAHCPNCRRGFNCDGSADCWCLKVDRNFDYEAMIVRTGATGCVCPVCLTGQSGLAEVEELPERQKSDRKS